MGLREWFTDQEHAPAGPPEPDYSSHGGQAGPHQTGQLVESARHLEALDQNRAAADLTPTQPTTHAVIPLIREIPERPDDWHAETFLIEPGGIVQVLGRDDQRESADLTNQTSLENNAGNGTPVFLFRDRQSAEQFVNAQPAPQRGKFAVVPDGAARSFRHTAPVWACIRASAPSSVVIDVTAERYKGARP